MMRGSKHEYAGGQPSRPPAASHLPGVSKLSGPAARLAAAMGPRISALFFPRRCPLCGEMLEYGDSAGICRACRSSLPLVRPPRCLRCSRTVTDPAEAFCADCREKEKHFRYGLALFDYDDRMQRAVTQIKYHNQRSFADPLSAMMAEKLGDEIRAMGAECLVPVPVHPARRKKRGFNQAELLAEGLGRRIGIPVRTDLLFRGRNTEAQKALTTEERFRNLLGAFRADPAAAAGVRSAILVDDIYTTGSTIEACATALQRAGVREVYFVSLCIVPEE